MSPSNRVDRLHLLGLGGSNKVMAGELSRLARRAFSQERSRELLGQPPQKSGPGGLLYPFAADLAALAVLYHRTSARCLWDLHCSYATRLEPLFEELCASIAEDDRSWMREGMSFSVLAFNSESVEAGERQVVGVVKNALIEGAKRRGIRLRLDPERPDLTFHARSTEDRAGKAQLVVSLDLAGTPMHRRGYRTASGEAPLREDLAANLVMLSRHDPRSEVFIDPLAGSGTLAIEAALMATGKAVWMSGRRPDAYRLPELESHLNGLGKPLFADAAPSIYAAEMDPEVYAAMDRNLATAGTSPQTTTFGGDFRDWDLASQLQGKKGLILSNPPYGARLGGNVRELRTLFRDLGDWCREFRGFRAGFIIGEPEADREKREGPSIVLLFQEMFGGEARVKKPIRNGPLHAQFLLYDL
jgi:23S rRNA G2445 N2-methylase RlmL